MQAVPSLISLADLTSELFQEHLASTFEIAFQNGETLSLELIEARQTGQGAFLPGGRNPFALLFRTGADRWPAQGIHRLQHPVLGMLDIFLVPVGPDEKGMRVEAIFT